MPHTNHYQILEVSQKATQAEIKEAYRNLAKRFHPDSNVETANAEKIILINAAYEILKDPRRRCEYDRQLLLSGQNSDFYTSRQQRTTASQERYRRSRQKEREADAAGEKWLDRVYNPIVRLVRLIVTPLKEEIECLSADPFDDRLMAAFQTYLENCRSYLERAEAIFRSQANPSKYAATAANLYYCLNHLSDGIDELERFTFNYDYHQLHLGQELVKMADRSRREAQESAQTLTREKRN